jgi:hypothetical protein
LWGRSQQRSVIVLHWVSSKVALNGGIVRSFPIYSYDSRLQSNSEILVLSETDIGGPLPSELGLLSSISKFVSKNTPYDKSLVSNVSIVLVLFQRFLIFLNLSLKGQFLRRFCHRAILVSFYFVDAARLYCDSMTNEPRMLVDVL